MDPCGGGGLGSPLALGLGLGLLGRVLGLGRAMVVVDSARGPGLPRPPPPGQPPAPEALQPHIPVVRVND